MGALRGGVSQDRTAVEILPAEDKRTFRVRNCTTLRLVSCLREKLEEMFCLRQSCSGDWTALLDRSSVLEGELCCLQDGPLLLQTHLLQRNIEQEGGATWRLPHLPCLLVLRDWRGAAALSASLRHLQDGPIHSRYTTVQ